MPAQRVSIVVPVYNSEQTLAKLVERLEDVLVPLVDDFEVVMVDDGSRDGSWDVVLELAATNPRVRGLRMRRNFGQHNALLCGLRAARHEVIVTMDDDLQHPPEEVPKLLDALTDDVDLVYGHAVAEEHSFLRSISSRTTKTAMALSMGVDHARSISAFRAMKGEIPAAFSANVDAFVSLDVLLSWTTTRIVAVPVRMDRRELGKSNYTFRKLVRHSLNMVTGYSAVPLRMVSWLGFGFALLGLTLFTFVMLRWLVSGSSVAGFTFTAAMIAGFSGAQMLAIGILGEYVGRMHFRSMDRPVYLVRTTTERALAERRLRAAASEEVGAHEVHGLESQNGS